MGFETHDEFQIAIGGSSITATDSQMGVPFCDCRPAFQIRVLYWGECWSMFKGRQFGVQFGEQVPKILKQPKLFSCAKDRCRSTCRVLALTCYTIVSWCTLGNGSWTGIHRFLCFVDAAVVESEVHPDPLASVTAKRDAWAKASSEIYVAHISSNSASPMSYSELATTLDLFCPSGKFVAIS